MDERASSDRGLDRLRRVSAVSTVVQLPLGVAAVAATLFAGRGWRPVTLVCVAVVVAIEVGQLLLARAARTRMPDGAAAAMYGERPLDAAQRSVVVLNLATTLLVPVVLVIIIDPAAYSRPAAWLVIILALLPGPLSLVRVLRHNTWLAVAPIPGRGGA